ncbi:FkbM family methyltransferase [Caulobacter sp. 17J65-9]|uniref:FkbM family methyltransferase n=1 Tax=Caulobacter sp. 17J65-9 TaxID=2709382 RepID=UPI0013C55592|nr:FkbM family methyltransferase [Caulobacter sp. 17J65-9]NEX95144.1 FkbM family methyltransferase [Caulobacter sp. 17J65-9]
MPRLLDRAKMTLKATDVGLSLRPVDPHLRFLKRVFGALGGAAAVDVGASDGFYSRVLASCFDMVVSLEPNPILAARLGELLPANCLVLAAAAGAAHGKATLRVPRYAHEEGHYRATLSDENQFAGTPVQGVDTVEVEVTPLDDLLRVSQRRVAVVKIDTEGFELPVLAGGRGLLVRHQPVMVVEIDRRQNPAADEVFDVLTAEGQSLALVERDRLVRLDRRQFQRLQADLAGAGGVLGYEPVNYLAWCARDDDKIAPFVRAAPAALQSLLDGAGPAKSPQAALQPS